MDELVERLQAEQPVAVGGPIPSVEDFKNRIDNIGYAFIKFTETRGGTDLGIQVDKVATNKSGADFDARSGKVHVEGTAILNYVKVRCIADIDLSTLKGTGRLVALEEVSS